MFTALTYILVSISLSVLFYFGAKEHHQVREGAEVFRTQSVVAWVLLGSAPGMAIAGGFIYSTFPPGEPHGIGLFIFIAIFTSLSIAYIFFYLSAKKYYVEIDDKTIRVGGLRPERVIRFADIRKIELTQGTNNVSALYVFDGNNRRLLKVWSTIQDFMRLVYLIKQRTRGNGVLYRERNKWGKWTEQQLH